MAAINVRSCSQWISAGLWTYRAQAGWYWHCESSWIGPSARCPLMPVLAGCSWTIRTWGLALWPGVSLDNRRAVAGLQTHSVNSHSNKPLIDRLSRQAGLNVNNANYPKIYIYAVRCWVSGDIHTCSLQRRRANRLPLIITPTLMHAINLHRSETQGSFINQRAIQKSPN